MDKNDAINLSKSYLDKVKQNQIEVIDAWLFGSYAKGNYNDDSDIDIALVLPESALSIDTDVKLMTLRRGKETMIETHTYSQLDFSTNLPIIQQIKLYGFRL